MTDRQSLERLKEHLESELSKVNSNFTTMGATEYQIARWTAQRLQLRNELREVREKLASLG